MNVMEVLTLVLVIFNGIMVIDHMIETRVNYLLLIARLSENKKAKRKKHPESAK